MDMDWGERARALQELMDRDPVTAVAEARQITDSTREARHVKAAILVDAGAAAGDGKAVGEALVILRQLWLERPDDPSTAYNLANCLTATSGPAPGTVSGFANWLQDTAPHRLEARTLYMEVAVCDRAPAVLRTQAVTNLAGALTSTYRLGEAHDARLLALRLDPNNGVAAAAAARDLEWLCSYCGCADTTRKEVGALARIAVENGDIVHSYLGASAGERLIELARRMEGPSARTPPTDPFLSWVEQERLTLGPTPEYVDPQLGKIDWLMLPSIMDRWSSEGSRRACLPAVFAMFNVLKSDFVLARSLAWQAQQEREQPTTMRLADTLDYARYDPEASAAVLAHRTAVDLLDKVAVLANHYFELGVSKRSIYFRTMWRKQLKSKQMGSVKSRVDQLIRNGCVALGGLVELADDYDRGWRKPLRDLRNAGTHRFVVLHDLGGEEQAHQAPEVERWSVQDFRRECVGALQVARSAMQVLAIAIAQHERVLRDGVVGPVGSLPVPDHDWVRGRE